MMAEQKQVIPEGYKQTEIGIFPNTWNVVHFSQLFDIISGLGFNKSEYSVDGLKLLRIDNVSYGDVIWESTAYLPFDYSIKHPKLVLNENDILLALNRPITNGQLKFAKVRKDDLPSILYQRVGKISLDNTLVDEDYSFYILGIYIKKFVEESAVGSDQPFISTSKLKKIQIPFPAIKEEQTVIANALSDVDALISELEKLIAKKQAIKTATMQQLLTGKTRLPQFALCEDGTPKGYKTSELGEIPEDWKVKTYGEIFTFLLTSTNSRADLSTEGDYGYVHYGDIHTKWNNRLDLDVVELPRISRNLANSAFIEDGDVIMADASEDYEGIGKSVEVSSVGVKQVVAGLHTFLLRDKEKLLSDGYRGYLHNISVVKSSFDRLATGLKVYGISKNNLKTVLLPIPSKTEQAAIATIIYDMDKEIQTLQQRLNKTRQIKQGMMQELLTGRVRLLKGEYA